MIRRPSSRRQATASATSLRFLPTRREARATAQAMAARADRPAGGQGGGVTFAISHARARDRGAGARRSGRAAQCARGLERAIGGDGRDDQARLAGGDGVKKRADRARACGRSISRSASGRTPRCSPRRSRCRRSAPASSRRASRSSTWNNPEPEIVLVVNAEGQDRRRHARQRREPARRRGPLGAAARRKAKDNNASCAIGPFIRLFDENFTLDDVRRTRSRPDASKGADGFELEGASSMSARSAAIRSISSAQTIGPAPPVSRRLRAVPRHDVRADAGPRRARAGLHAPARATW